MHVVVCLGFADKETPAGPHPAPPALLVSATLLRGHVPFSPLVNAALLYSRVQSMPGDKSRMWSSCASDLPTKRPGGTAPGAPRHSSAACASSSNPKTRELHALCKPCSLDRRWADLWFVGKAGKSVSASVPRAYPPPPRTHQLDRSVNACQATPRSRAATGPVASFLGTMV